jgi:ADP-ribose pyrophosphatase YjhB (NUDIX family)
MTQTIRPRFCSQCAHPLASGGVPPLGRRESYKCERCGHVASVVDFTSGPELLVLVLIHSEEKLLLLKRGVPPYASTWAPPGGYVEAGESVESAALRETEEEVGIRLQREQLVPLSILSLPALNQVYVTFTASLAPLVPAKAVAPEALSVRWFSESEFRTNDIWPPFAMSPVSTTETFDLFRPGERKFYQQSDTFYRVFSQGEITYLWRKP